MSNNRYSELKYEGQTYTEQWKIDEILIKEKFNWIVNAEIKNARLEISQDTLVWNAGIWYNGNWFFGVWRDGEWKYGTWENGVWYNGTWRNGTFKSGIIYKGHFFKGKILSGEIRGGQFIDIEIDPKVIEYTGNEYQAKQQEEQKQLAPTATAQPVPVPTTDVVKVHGTPPASQQQIAQPKVQQENNSYKMKHIKPIYEWNEEIPSESGFDSNESNLKTKLEDIIGQVPNNLIDRCLTRLENENQLKTLLKDIFELNDLEKITGLINILRNKNIDIVFDPPYKDVYWYWVKKWHTMLKENDEKRQEEVFQKISAPIQKLRQSGEFEM